MKTGQSANPLLLLHCDDVTTYLVVFLILILCFNLFRIYFKIWQPLTAVVLLVIRADTKNTDYFFFLIVVEHVATHLIVF